MILVISIIFIVLSFTFVIWNWDIAVSVAAIIIVMITILLLMVIGVVYYLANREKDNVDIKKTKAYRCQKEAEMWAKHALSANVNFLEGSLRRYEDRDGIVYYAFVFRRDVFTSSVKGGTRCLIIMNSSSMEPQDIIDNPSSDQCENPFEDFNPKEREKFMAFEDYGEERRKPKNSEYTSFKDFVNSEGE